MDSASGNGPVSDPVWSNWPVQTDWQKENRVIRPLATVVAVLMLGSCGRPAVGNQILLSTNQSGNWEVSVFDLDRSLVFPVTNDPGTDTDPVWSPD